MMKLAVFFAIMFCLSQIGQSEVRYAKCKFHGERGENYAAGDLRLKEDASGQVWGRFDVHVMDTSMNGPFGVHVHTNSPRDWTCRRMKNIIKGGHIGKFSLNGDVIHDMDFKLNSKLKLVNYRENKNGIINRGIRLHLTSSGKAICCKLLADNSADFEKMKDDVKKAGHFHHHK